MPYEYCRWQKEAATHKRSWIREMDNGTIRAEGEERIAAELLLKLGIRASPGRVLQSNGPITGQNHEPTLVESHRM